MTDQNVSYSFIDIAVWEGVREGIVAGQPMVVFSNDLSELLWTNGAAAALFGFSSIGDFETEGPDGLKVALRQIRASAMRIGDAGSVRTLLRVASGMTSRLLPATVRRILGADGKHYLAVFIQEVDRDSETQEALAQRAIAGLDAEGAGAAIIDGAGELLASNTLFSRQAIPQDELMRLVRDVSAEEDRLVKRIIVKGTDRLAVAIARLADAPPSHLVVAVNSLAEEALAEPKSVVQPEPAGQERTPAGISARTGSLLDVGLAAPEFDELAPETRRSPPDAVDFEPDLARNRRPVRFVWKIDRDGRFVDISREFADAVGPNAADVLGRTFEEIARVFELDPSGEIGASLKRRDTWSGKSVLWPVQGTEMRVPVDLAALPSYNRDREFEGYRGFGIARVGEAQPDPEALGLSLAGGAVLVQPEPEPEDTAEPDVGTDADEAGETVKDASPDPFMGEVPVLASIAPAPLRRETDKIIDLNSKRRERPSGETLNPSEQAAFRQIGDALGWARAKAGTDNVPGGGTADSEPDEGADDAGTDIPIESAAVRPAEESGDTASDEQAAISREQPAGDKQPAGGGASAEPDEAAPALARDVMPSAFATRQSPPAPGSETGAETGLSPDFIEGLPLPVLIHRNGEALFANSAFSDMTGYENTAAFNAAGGIDALFDGDHDGEGVLSLGTADGDSVSVRAHMQTVPWGDGTALMFAFEQKPAMRAEPGDRSDTGESVSALTQLTDVEELRAILDTATDGVVVLSQDGVIRSINGSASALFGYSSDEAEGKSFSLLFAQESQAPALNYVHGLANNGVASVLNEGLEVLGREKNGGFLPLFMTIGRLEKSNGFCAVVRDITAWKQTEQALLDAQRKAESASSHKTEFLAKISHEIRTPLNAIIGFSELMAEERFGPIGNERYKSYLADINKSGKYVLDLVNDLLDISKIEAGKQELEFDSVSLNEAVMEAVAMIQPQANRNRVIIRSSLDEDLPDVVADARSLKQIVLNLLSNSVRFTHSGGQVIINSSYNARGEVVLRIKDTGIGMSAKEIETALQPFQQVASLGRARGDGTGLGLPLTKALVEANRAEFAIQSEPGRGTAVEIVFPPSRVLAS